MKVSVPTAYRREEPAKVLETGDSEVPALPAIPEPEGPPLPPLSAQWWQGFLHGNPDALLTAGDAIRAHELIAEVLGNKEASQLEIGASVRSSELRKLLYARFGADVALRTMHELWQQAASNGEPLSAPSVSDTPETVLKFFEREDPVPSRRWESDEERTQRERLTELGGWCG